MTVGWVVGPGTQVVSLSLYRTFSYKERISLRLGASASIYSIIRTTVFPTRTSALRASARSTVCKPPKTPDRAPSSLGAASRFDGIGADL